MLKIGVLLTSATQLPNGKTARAERERARFVPGCCRSKAFKQWWTAMVVLYSTSNGPMAISPQTPKASSMLPRSPCHPLGRSFPPRPRRTKTTHGPIGPLAHLNRGARPAWRRDKSACHTPPPTRTTGRSKRDQNWLCFLGWCSESSFSLEINRGHPFEIHVSNTSESTRLGVKPACLFVPKHEAIWA